MLSSHSSPASSEEVKHDDGFRAFVFPSRVGSATRAYRAALGPRALLAPGVTARGGSWVGQGEALQLRGTPEEIARAATRVTASLRGSELSARFVGGFAFDTTRTPAGPWTGFPVGHFVLPRLQWFERDGAPQILVIASAHESRADVANEVLAFEARAERDAGSSARSVHATLAANTASTTVMVSGDGERAAWTNLVERAVRAFDAGTLEKVVAARELGAESNQPFDPASLIEALGETPAARFAIDVAGATFLGASPELLIRKRERVVGTEALAGSEPRRGGDDDAEIERLCSSQKDRREHHFVVEAIEAALQPFTDELRVPERAEVRTLPTVHHLQRAIDGTLARDVHVLELVAALHPTPAVCGTPREAARDWLRDNERLERGYYAGPVGFFDTHGDGEFHVALRSALVRGARAWLYAGAGLVPGSEADREFTEVEAKLRVMKSALAPNEVRRPASGGSADGAVR